VFSVWESNGKLFAATDGGGLGVATVAVPEPTTLGVAAFGLAGVVGVALRRRKQA
jgi:hypothetical protein